MAGVGVERPLVLLALPVAVSLLWFLIVRGSEASETGRRTRAALFASRLLVVGLLVVAAAGPYTVAARETTGDARVTLLVDGSASMAVAPSVADGLERDLEARGVAVSRRTIATENRSPIGDAVADALRPRANLVLVSDGRVTSGRSLDAAAELAGEANATISSIEAPPGRAERAVRLRGPATTSAGVENRFLVRVSGVSLEGRAASVTVRVDGEQVASERVTGEGSFEVVHTFETPGAHRVTARVASADVHGANDVAYRSVRVVDPPRILYVSRASYPLEGYLNRLYDVTTARSVPSDLSPYYAVVLHDLAAADVGDAAALQEYVIDGGGLAVVGGEHAFEAGGYEASTLGSMLPVRTGRGTGRAASIVLAIDVSGSTTRGMRVQKALAIDVLDQLGDRHRVGIVAFNRRAHRIAGLSALGTSREELAHRIRRLQSRGRTSVAAGLAGADQLLGGQGGTVILVTDGRDKAGGAVATARQLGDRGTAVIAIGVGGRTNARLLRSVADASGGTFYRADETNRLRLQFGDEGAASPGALAVVRDDHFITAGTEPTASLSRANDVSVKAGADYLVAAGSGVPAITAWRYGLGRVVAITAYGEAGGLDGLLVAPDAALVSKSVNWAIGDPRRKETGVATVADGRVGEPTTVVYRGAERPSARLSFQRVGEGVYRARIVPDRAGYHSLLGAEYAADYPAELATFGPAPALDRAVETTGGRTFAPGEAGAIAAFATERATRVRETRTGWAWALLVAALLVYLAEVAARRLRAYRGARTGREAHT